MADTYYAPSGGEHVQQTPVSDEVTDIVARRVLAGDHVHMWSKDTGSLCMGPDGTETKVPRDGTCERETE